MKYQAFISCDPADRDLAAAVKAALTDAGLTCAGYEDLAPGENYQKALVDAIGESKTLIFIPPSGFGADSTIHSEVETAVKLKRTVIPYYRGESELDDSLRFLTQNSVPIRADEDADSLGKVVEAVRAAKEPDAAKSKKKTLILVAAVAAVLLIAGALLLVLLRREPEPSATGQYGENTWSFYDGSGKLVISGQGSGLDYDYDIVDKTYTKEKAPWYDVRESVRSIVVEEGVTEIGFGAFCDMPNLEEVTFPGTMKMLSTQVVCQCPKIKEITIPEGVKAISYGAFLMCDSLERIRIPSSAEIITGAICQLCPKLTEIEIDPDNRNYAVSEGVLYSRDMTELVEYPSGSSAVSYSMPDTVETVKACAVMSSESLTEIHFSANLRTIEVFAFSDVSISRAQLPDGLTDIGMSAFSGCTELSDVSLPDGLTTISDFAFFGCSALKEIAVPASVTEIGSVAFGYGENEKEEIEVYDIVISGKAGSAAEAYADQYYITFKAVD